MCHSSSCLLSLLLGVILFFGIYIVFLLKLRKRLLQSDLDRTGQSHWNQLKSQFEKSFTEADFLYSTWQDASPGVSRLIIRNTASEVVAEVEFPAGHRDYPMKVQKENFRISVNVTVCGTSCSLINSDGQEIARFVRKAFHLRKHQLVVPTIGKIDSKSEIFNIRAPFSYELNGQNIGHSFLISKIRKVGRACCFSQQLPLPIQVFELALTS